MTLRPDVEALIQGAVDDTLTLDERETLDRLMAESIEVRGRLAHLQELARLLESLGPSEPPARLVPDVLARIADGEPSADLVPRAAGRVTTFQTRTSGAREGFAARKMIFLGLAAAAVLVLGFMTFRGYPPATEGTEATIGAAPRAQTPQIDAGDVALGDTSARNVLQTETWDAIAKDESLRRLLQDANVRTMLQDAGLRQALADAEIRKALGDPELGRRLRDTDLASMLNDPELSTTLENAAVAKKLADANLLVALGNEAFVRALRNDEFRRRLSNADFAAALAGPALERALADPGFPAALRQAQLW